MSQRCVFLQRCFSVLRNLRHSFIHSLLQELDPTPTKITIAVTTEREDENMSRVDSQQGSDLGELRMNKV